MATKRTFWDYLPGFQDAPPLEDEIFHLLEGIENKNLTKTVNQAIRKAEISLEKFETLYRVKSPYEWSYRFFFDRAKIYQSGLTISKIASKIEEFFLDLYCVPFPDSYQMKIKGKACGVIDIYVDTSEIEEPSTPFIIDDHEYLYMSLMVSQINHLPITGIPGIDKVFIKKWKRTPAEKEEWNLETEGSNLLGVFANPLADSRYVYTNDLWENMAVFGIEVARTCLITELSRVIVASGEFVNTRHIELLVDGMTRGGKISGITRYGMNRKILGPLAMASFEQTLLNIKISAFKGEVDPLQNNAARVILGKNISCGTGHFDLALPAPEGPYPEIDDFVASLLPKEKKKKPGLAIISSRRNISIR